MDLWPTTHVPEALPEVLPASSVNSAPFAKAGRGLHPSVRDLHVHFDQRAPQEGDLALGEMVARSRPAPLRAFDQIPMRTPDLVRQVRAIAPYVAGQRVAFIGDYDGASLVLGSLISSGEANPVEMHILDFDLRVLKTANAFAKQHGLDHLLSIRAYNVFDAVPSDLRGHFDWFYINPPYGASNEGLSARLFLSRGMELTKRPAGGGFAILPCDPSRHWAYSAWQRTQAFLRTQRWSIIAKVDGAHQYHLDDDQELSSSLIVMQSSAQRPRLPLPYQERRVNADEIEDFYGRSVKPPYPRYIREDGSADLGWNDHKKAAA